MRAYRPFQGVGGSRRNGTVLTLIRHLLDDLRELQSVVECADEKQSPGLPIRDMPSLIYLNAADALAALLQACDGGDQLVRVRALSRIGRLSRSPGHELRAANLLADRSAGLLLEPPALVERWNR